MRTYIALFRGINIGGRNILRMKELRTLLKKLGFRNVRTYIQSGNAVFQSESLDRKDLSSTISAVVKKGYGFEPKVLVLKKEDLEQALANNPFPEAETEPKSLHFLFLESNPENPNLEAIEEIRIGRERFELKDKVFYLHAPDGVGRSKLAANVEKLMGVPMTGRNWRTVERIMSMVEK